MPRPTNRHARRVIALALLASVAGGCSNAVDVRPRTLRKARQTWEQANIKNYELEWTSTGPQTGRRGAHYRVKVRDGNVQSVEAIQPDGIFVPVNTKKPEYFGIEGLFRTMEEEMAQLDTDKPFGQPKGTRVVLQFTPDEKYGFPHSYRRDVMTVPQGVAIDVVKFEPK
jgi:hypothetical protein